MSNDLPCLAPRNIQAHKGTFGTTLIIAGSKGMSGAAILSGIAALKSGSGLVRIACPASIQTEVALGNPCYTTLALSEDKEGKFNHKAINEIATHLKNVDAVVLGPGVVASKACEQLILHLLDLEIPVLLDADALNSLSIYGIPSTFKNKRVVITPHPGEFARLTRLSISDIQSNRVIHAQTFSQKYSFTVILKGFGTIVTDGTTVYTNSTGNPGMATGGSGDVLSGIIGALLAQGLTVFDAAKLGVYLHGLAGDFAKAKLGEHSLTALDILTFIPDAFLAHLDACGNKASPNLKS